MAKRRNSPSSNYPKISRSISFVGEGGYEMLDFFDVTGENFEYGKSGLVIELLKIYKEAVQIFGHEDALFEMKKMIRKKKRDNT